MRLLTTFLLALTVSACSNDQNADGKQLYEQHCADCHQKLGQGRFFYAIPPSRDTSLSQKEVIQLIRRGHSNKPDMPAMPQISKQQANKIAQHLWTLRQQAN